MSNIGCGPTNTALALVDDWQARARLIASVRGVADIHLCMDAAELEARLAGSWPTAVVLEPRDPAGRCRAPLVTRLVRLYPSLPIVALCSRSHVDARELPALVRAGLMDCVIWSADDDELRGQLRGLFSRAARRASSAAIFEQLSPLVESRVRPILQCCLQHAEGPVSVAAVASALGLSRKTLANRCRAAGVPAPSALVSWARILQAARLIENRASSMYDIALALEFPSEAALRHLIRRHMGLRPSQIREYGGFQRVVDSFAKRLRTTRPQTRLSGESRPAARGAASRALGRGGTGSGRPRRTTGG